MKTFHSITLFVESITERKFSFVKIRKEVKSAMEQLHVEKLRPNQLKPINRILDGKDTLLIAATSFGKSLIAQIPAIILKDKLTVIIEPLTALSHDQVEKLQNLGIVADYLDSTQSKDEQQRVLKMLKKRELTLLYLSPEKLNPECIPHEIYKNDIGLVVVDECHCVTFWGYTFREDYLHIGDFIDSLKHHPTVLAMTASAPPEDRSEIMELLSMQDAKCITTSLYRSNLHFMKHAVTSRSEQLKVLKKYMKKFHKHTTIIYCSTKNTVEEVAKRLKKIYPGEVVAYHSKDRRGEKDMLSGKKHIIVATSALAMGVSIRDVDLVIHYNMPLSIPDYYQMSGRAGREGQKARSILIYNSSDYQSNRYLLEDIDDPNTRKIVMERLDAMKELCEDREHCIYTMILSALGEKRKTRCRYCTNCQKER